MRGFLTAAALFSLWLGGARAADLPGGLLNNSHTCGICHRDIYRMWKASSHSRSLESPVFLHALEQAVNEEGTEVSAICLRCHSPLALETKDTRLEKQRSWDGVGCDVCHSLASVDTTGANPRMTFDLGEVKRGPIRDAQSGAHAVVYSELHTQALLCAGCHEYTNGEGTPILTTVSEWRRSAAHAAGKICQDCHMGRTEAKVVDPKVARLADAAVNLHEVPGGHSIEQLNRAIRATFRSQHRGDSLEVEVELCNRGAGHAVPTGMPGRRLILAVKVQTDQGKIFEDRRIYSKSFVDAAGQPVEEEGRCFGKGVRLGSDTRLQAGETRTEVFRFPVPRSSGGSISFKVHYEHSPTATPEGRTWLTVVSEDRTFPAL